MYLEKHSQRPSYILIEWIYWRKIPHMGNTWPSRMCVIQEYRFYTMSLSQYHWSCQYHESMTIPWVRVYTKSPCIYHDYMSLPWFHVYTMSSCLYYDSMYIPWVNVYTMIPCLYYDSMSLPWVFANNKSHCLYYESRNSNYRNTNQFFFRQMYENF